MKYGYTLIPQINPKRINLRVGERILSVRPEIGYNIDPCLIFMVFFLLKKGRKSYLTTYQPNTENNNQEKNLSIYVQ